MSLFEFFEPGFELAPDVGDAIKEEVYPNALEFFFMAVNEEEGDDSSEGGEEEEAVGAQDPKK